MKKIYTLGLAIATIVALAACAKENTVKDINAEQEDINLEPTITVKANIEDINIPSTKVSIVENSTKFNLNWDGSEQFIVYNSTNNKGGASNVFTIASHSGTSATLTGTPSDAGGGSTNYIATMNWNSSQTDYVRADLPQNQTYAADGAVASNCLLIGRADDVTSSTLSSFDIKTMNAFMKFSLKKGSAAAGSSNTYTKMYVQSIKVETIADGEALAGRFGFAKTGAWGSIYDEVVTAQKKSSVTLNCVTGVLTDGVELDPSTPTDFYIAVAFGTYSKGLRVTITVKNQDDDLGEYVRTISNGSSYDIARNTLVAMPALVVNPDDKADEVICWSETWDNGIANNSPSTYLSGSADGFYKLSGTITYAQSSASNVYVIAAVLAGGSTPELMIKSGATWTISGIPTASASTLSLEFLCNNGKAVPSLVSASNATISGSGTSYTITTGGDSTVNIRFTASGGNTRVDNVVVKVAD